MHENQFSLSRSDVVRLVRGLRPSVAEEEITAVESTGTVNCLYRVGTRYAAKFPMETEDVAKIRATLVAEHAAMREFAAVSTVSSPAPVSIGEPHEQYPLPWSVPTWIEGEIATTMGGSLSAHSKAKGFSRWIDSAEPGHRSAHCRVTVTM